MSVSCGIYLRERGNEVANKFNIAPFCTDWSFQLLRNQGCGPATFTAVMTEAQWEALDAQGLLVIDTVVHFYLNMNEAVEHRIWSGTLKSFPLEKNTPPERMRRKFTCAPVWSQLKKPGCMLLRAFDADETVQQLIRNFGTILTRSGAMWWGYPWTPSAERGAWADPKIRGCVRTLARLGRYNVEGVAEHSPAADIAVIVDTDSERYVSGDYTLAWSCVVRQRIWELSRMGAPHDVYHLDDLVAGRLRAYKLVVFLQDYATDETRTAAIHEYLARSGAVALWLYACGYVDRSGGRQTLSLESVSRLTGVAVRGYPVEWPPTVTITDYSHPMTQRLPEHVTYGAAAPYGPVLSSTDAEAVTLGTIVHLMGKCEGGLVVKEQAGWRSVWSAVPHVPAKLLREIARWAGVHVWLERDEVMAASRDWLMVHTLKGGEIAVNLPRAADVFDAVTGKAVARGAAGFTVNLPRRSSGLYYHGEAPWPKA